MDENKKRFETEIERIQRHFEAILEKLEKMKKRHEKKNRRGTVWRVKLMKIPIIYKMKINS